MSDINGTNYQAKRFPCDYCDKIYTCIKARSRHIHHIHLEKETDKYMCSFCQKKFRDLCVLKVHQRNHTGERPFNCKQCSQTFTSNSNLNRHIRSLHKKERLNACEYCGETFFEKYNLEQHIRIHTGEKPFNCTECDKVYRTYSEVRKHVLKDHVIDDEDLKNEKQNVYTCSFCKENFKNSTLYRSHVIKCTKKKYACQLCLQTFTRNFDFKMHVKKLHGTQRPYECSLCQRRFETEEKLSAHDKWHKRSEKQFKCEKCSKVFSQSSGLKAHLKNKCHETSDS